MHLLVCSLIEWSSPDGQQEIMRLLHIDPSCNEAQVIRIDRPDALPEARQLSELEAALTDNRIRVLTSDPFAYLHQPEEAIPAKHRKRRDAAWAIIEPIVTAPGGAAFHSESRGRLLRESIKNYASSKHHVYRYLRRYWQAGMTPNALLPHFHVCGGRGKERKPGTKKRGRPRQLKKLKGAPPGINIGSTEAEKIRKGYRQFYEKTPENGGRNLRRAYEDTLRKYFKSGLEFRAGVLVPVLPSTGEIPSYRQFVYWARKGADFKDSLLRRQGERTFNLRSRALLGDSTLMAFGPGSLFQIDSTIADTWVVSALDRSRRIGRPVMYLIMDAFSHLIAGFHVGLENPSFFAAGLALENAIADKSRYCAQLGIQITAEDWPNCGLPEAILADRGEMEGYGATNLVQSLGIRIASTSPYRADLKGIVERCFRSMNDLLLHNLPGATRKQKERGERDPRLDAVLTLHEFRILMIHAILQENARRIESYRLQKDMIADGIEPRPVDLWHWGISNRFGHLRTADPQVVRANLLPSEKATVTHHGIKFRKVFYSCDRAVQERWFEKARTSRSWQIEVAYDPRLADTLFLRLPGTASVEPCQLVQADQRFCGCSWADLDDFLLSQREAKEDSRGKDLQSRINLHAQVGSIVDHAVEQAAIANRGLTKATRLGNVRPNRQSERENDWAGGNGEDACADTEPGGNAEANGKLLPNTEPVQTYVPPPSPLEMLRKQREAQWSNNE